MADFPYMEWLTREYKERAESSGHWTDYVKAHGLANFCVVKDCREERKQLVYSIEDSWYNGRHPLSYVEHQRLIKQHKSRLQSYREEVRTEYAKLEAEANKLVVHEIFDERNLSQAQTFSDRVFAASKKSSQGLLEMSKNIINSSIEILQLMGLMAPCKFAVIGLGSLAKGEATPYSDLEYAFIVEREDEMYFEKLAVDSYFRIGNLGETPLKHFDIEELAAEKGCVVDRLMPTGLRIDGLTKKAGNIPTGNGRDGSQVLTLTLDKYIELYRTSAESPFDGIPGDMSDMLASSVVIYTNEGEKSQLYEDFMKARIQFELEKDLPDVQKKRLQSFIHDITSYTFLPEFVKFQPPNNLDIKVKADIYRYPTLLANNVKMLMGWNLRYSWDIFSNLHRQGMLTNENYRYITIVLALSMYMRTSAYINCGSQTEFVSLIPTIGVTTTTKYHVPGALFVLLGALLLPIKRSITSEVEAIIPNSRPEKSRPQNSIGTVNEVIKPIFQNIRVSKSHYLQQAEVCYFAGRYDLVKTKLSKQLGVPVDSVDCNQFLKLMQQAQEDDQPAEKWVELCCYSLYYTGSFSSAVSYFQWLMDQQYGNVKLLKLLTAHCLQELGDNEAAQNMLVEAKKAGGSYVSGDHEDTYISYEGIGLVHSNLAEFKIALDYFTRGLCMSERINGELHSHSAGFHHSVGVTHMALGNYTLSQQHLTKSLDIVNALVGDVYKHHHTARIYISLGTAHRHRGNYKDSLNCYKSSLDIQKAIHGETSRHPDVANCYNRIGTVYGDIGEHSESLRYHLQAKEMMEATAVYTKEKMTLAHIYLEVGTAYGEIENYISSLQYHKKSLEVFQAIYGTEAKVPQIALAYSGIGKAYRHLGRHTSSLEYHTQALEINQAIYGVDANHEYIASSYENLASVFYELKKYSLSLCYNEKALKMTLACYGDDINHCTLAKRYYNMGKCYGNLGQHGDSLKHHLRASDEWKVGYGPDTNHIDIADNYDDIGNEYHHLAKNKLSLEYHIKALDMRKAIHGSTSNHPQIGMGYHNVGLAYGDLKDYIHSIEYLEKAVNLRKAIYGDASNHPSIEESEISLNHAYRSLSDLCRLALAYYSIPQ